MVHFYMAHLKMFLYRATLSKSASKHNQDMELDEIQANFVHGDFYVLMLYFIEWLS